MHLIDQFAAIAENYISDSHRNPVYPATDSIQQLQQFKEPLQDHPISPEAVLDLLNEKGSPATVKTSGGRYFGFVTGGSLPAAMMAKLLAAVWDQNSAMYCMSPVSAELEEITGQWLVDVLRLPADAGVGFVTGATMANFTALASARHALLKKAGWNVEARGLFHAPEITVIVGEEVHVSVLKALNMIGFGRERVIRVPADDQGRILPYNIPDTDGPTIICLQAGNVNTGAFDPIEEVCRNKKENVWVHVDGAFGLWAGASEKTRQLVKGIELADSWATDAHKWLNAPYDSGLVFVRDQQALGNALSASAAYLQETGNRDPMQFTPEMSREARGVPIWAALKSLGKLGLAKMINSHCEMARYFANQFSNAGYSILNEVVLNQVLVSFGDAVITREVIKKIQAEGTCWCGGTTWQGKTAMRISVSSWATTVEDVDLSINSILKAADEVIQASEKNSKVNGQRSTHNA